MMTIHTTVLATRWCAKRKLPEKLKRVAKLKRPARPNQLVMHKMPVKPSLNGATRKAPRQDLARYKGATPHQPAAP